MSPTTILPRDSESPKTLVETLERVRQIVRGYDAYVRRFSIYVLWRYVLSPSMNVRLGILILRNDSITPARRKSSEIFRAIAPPTLRESPYFELVCGSGNWLDDLAAHVSHQVPWLDAKGLLAISRIKAGKPKGASWLKPLGVVLSAGTLLLHEVPNAVLESLGINKADFEVGVFGYTAVTLGYLLLVLGPFYLLDRREAKARDLAHDVLIVLAAQQDAKSSAG